MQDQKFDLTQVTNYFSSKADGDVAIYYELNDTEAVSSRGIVEICPSSNRITKFLEKPSQELTSSRNASVVFFCMRASTIDKMDQ